MTYPDDELLKYPDDDIPPWISDVEEYLEFLFGDKDSLAEQHGELLQQPSSKQHIQPNPRKCPHCATVFHLTKRGSGESCPFCRKPLNFIIA